MKIIVIRHGESEADLLDVHEGRAGFSLTQRGHHQAASMAEFVRKNYSVSKIFSSTLKRAVQTAEYLSAATGVQVIFDDRLMEFNNGLLAGLTKKEASEKYPLIADLPADRSVYGQESKLAFRNRADAFLTELISESGSEDTTVAVISHGGMINQLYHSLLKLPIESGLTFVTGDTGIHVWEISSSRVRVVNANMCEHLAR